MAHVMNVSEKGRSMAENSGTQQADQRTILLVEDSATQALRLKALLEEQGLLVAWASGGGAGLQMARQLRPDLILLDVQMPDMNGFQVCRQLKGDQDTVDIPIIMLTRHDDSEAVVLGVQLGVTDYIPKDAFADAVLLETLRQMGLIVVRRH
jgi:DNA-binding response OmpR family regulator